MKKFLYTLSLLTILSSCSNKPSENFAENTNISNSSEVISELLEKIEETKENIQPQWVQKIPEQIFHLGQDISHFDEETRKNIQDLYKLNKKAELEFLWNSFPWIDINSLEFLSVSMLKDKNGIYKVGTKTIEQIPVVDIATFEKIDDEYFQDKNVIFSGTGKRLPHIDRATFKSLGFGIWQDKNGIYNYGEKIEIEPKNFTLLSEKYFINDGKLYTFESRDWNNVIIEVANRDIWNFQVLSKNFTKDKNNVYYNNEILEWADSNSFEVLTDIFSKDKNFVYEFDKKTEYDAKSFIKIGEMFLKDKNHLLMGIIEIEAPVDLASFEVIDKFHTRDKNAIYDGVASKKFNFDVKTFEVLNINYSKDKNRVYDVNEIIPEANPKTFIALNENFGKDDKNIFYRGEVFKPNYKNNADYDTFEALGWEWSKDKNGVYYWTNPIDADIESFRALNYKYGIDKNTAFYDGNPMKNVDVESFVTLTNWHAKDKNFFYYEWKPIRENK